MIKHNVCGHEMNDAILKYYPLIATCNVMPNLKDKLEPITEHNVTQIYKNPHTPECLPTLYCENCGDYDKLEQFTIVTTCPNCKKHRPCITMGNPYCVYTNGKHKFLKTATWVCEDCMYKCCLSCERNCSSFRFAKEDYYDFWRSYVKDRRDNE